MPEIPSLEALAARAAKSAHAYHEFLRVASMSVGLYRLPPGASDQQQPHGEDEVYYVLQGRGRFRHNETDRPVRAGDFLYVPAREPHRFHSIEEELLVLVVFAPPEGSAPARPPR